MKPDPGLRDVDAPAAPRPAVTATRSCAPRASRMTSSSSPPAAPRPPSPGSYRAEEAGFTVARPLRARSGDFATHDAGDDVDLALMPADLAAACRAAWARIAGSPRSAIHGDLTSGNLLWTGDGRPALVYRGEARLDAVLFDTAETAPDRRPQAAHRAAAAWEIAVCRQAEPGRARGLAAAFLAPAMAGPPQPGY